jgi:hypothetical protein
MSNGAASFAAQPHRDLSIDWPHALTTAADRLLARFASPSRTSGDDGIGSRSITTCRNARIH